MLQLKNIKKDYLSGEETVHALKGLDLAFRENEFVSILGQSGCGKTTLLNIIGGLDRYTSGDLIINGRSTKEYKDRDWDSYRNHSVGFVFQSYNLIPHQNVLSNVELALTLSGVSKAERRRRAKEALQKVGLGDQLKKRPSQMSGGQMQRVAIARALVNNPDILLADEPTGALDSETSIQVMEILKEVAKDRLVIMVTHNPELAEQYSTRIIRLLDGEVKSDTMPFDPEKEGSPAPAETDKKKKTKKTSMSFATAFGLSLNNLMTKKGRTILTAFAGSIGIIGIALILSLSNGIQNYIDSMEEETLTSYPITIESASMDTSSMMTSMMKANEAAPDREEGTVTAGNIMTSMIGSIMTEIATNDLTGFKEYLEAGNNDITDLATEIQYTYDTEVGIYTTKADGSVTQVNPCNIMEQIGLGDMGTMMSYSAFISTDVVTQLVDNQTMRDNDYELLTGAWPQNYNEVVLTVTNNYTISDYTLYALGLLDMDSLTETMQEMVEDITENGTTTKEYDTELDQTAWTYEDLMNLELKLVLPCDYYEEQEDGTWKDMRDDEDYMAALVEQAEPLKVVGIVRASSESSSEYGTIGYTEALTEYVIQQTAGSEVVLAQQADENTDIFTGKPFPGTEEAEAIESEMAEKKAELEQLQAEAGIAAEEETGGVSAAQSELLAGVMTQIPEAYAAQFSAMSEEEQAAALIEYGMLTQEDWDALAEPADETESEETEVIDNGYVDPKELISDSSYDENMALFYALSADTPSSISIYTGSFDDKEALTDALDAYNDEQEAAGNDEKVIRYTDYVGLLMSSVTSIVNVVSYVLIAFVGISLVVSSIMIGVITLISVQERTKEIGILRAMGASKKDISRVFNAETLIVGLSAGILGIAITLLLNIPINAIIVSLTDIDQVAVLPTVGGIVLIVISVVLTMIAGLIPSKTAARKDPVEALRTE